MPRGWLPFAAVVLGAIYAFYLLRHGVHPLVVDWLSANGEAAQHHLGWVLFAGDQWHWPLTFTRTIAFPTGSSIAFTDSLPIVAIPAKVLAKIGLLPNPVQYLGPYTAAALALQFYWGARLGQLLSRGDRFCATLAGLFFLLSPPLCRRVGMHTALTSHWLILGALWVYLAAGRGWSWRYLVALNGFFLFASTGLHPYLAVMVAGLAVATCLRAFFLRVTGPRTTLLLLGSIPALLLFGWWIFGYVPGAASGSRYGYYCLNLLCFVDPQQYSFFFDQIPIPKEQAGGYAYLGLGMIGLVLLNARYLARRLLQDWRRSSLAPLFLIVVCFFVFALGDRIYLGNRVIFTYPLPEWLAMGLGVFRASNRFVWPLYYFVTVAVLAASFRFAHSRRGRTLLCALVVIQFVDLVPLHQWRTDLVARLSNFSEPLTSPQWSELSQQHQKLVVLPSMLCTEKNAVGPYTAFARVAAREGLLLNSFYLARKSPAIQKAQCELLPRSVREGRLDLETAYVLGEEYADAVGRINSTEGASHTCSTVDGYVLCVRREFPLRQ